MLLLLSWTLSPVAGRLFPEPTPPFPDPSSDPHFHFPIRWSFAGHKFTGCAHTVSLSPTRPDQYPHTTSFPGNPSQTRSVRTSVRPPSNPRYVILIPGTLFAKKLPRLKELKYLGLTGSVAL